MNVFWIVLAVVLLLLAGMTCLLIYFASRSIEETKQGNLDATLIYDILNQEANAEKSKASRRVRKTFSILLDVLVVLLSAVFLVSFLDRAINAFDLPFQTMVIASGSMSERNAENQYLFENHLDDQLQVDDLIGVARVSSLQEIRLYDIVCYRNDDGVRIVHRVIARTDAGLVTRGDANAVSDDTRVTMDNLIGVYTHFRVPRLGIVVFFVQSNYGILACCGIFYVLLLYDQCSKAQERCAAKRRKDVFEKIGSAKEYVIVSKCGTLSVQGKDLEYGNTTTDEGTSYLLQNGQRIDLPESEFSLWKTN